jgi:NADPH:quinone reductase-like Zn-dependent oxidoreductase
VKAIVHDTYGGPEVLELRDIDQPAAKDDEVLVRAYMRLAWILASGMS